MNLDKNVASVIEKQTDRAKRGLSKYGVDTTRKDLTRAQWLVHLQEELMDAAIYAEKLIANEKDMVQDLDVEAFLTAFPYLEETRETLILFKRFCAVKAKTNPTEK